MSPADIRAAIAASTELQALADAGDHIAVAHALSQSRTRTVPTEIGYGTILETLGLAVGNALIDAIQTIPAFRHVVPLLQQGRLRLDSPVTQAGLDMLVGTFASGEQFLQSHASALRALCEQPDPITAMQVAEALEAA